MARKFHYFNLNGLGEPIRYLLHFAGHKFEDIRHELKKWPISDFKETLPYGQLPLYEEDGKYLNQSLAIARYIASKTNLLPSDAWEQAELDAVVYNIYDFWSKVIAYFKETDPVKKAAAKKEILEETIDLWFTRFEKELKKNKGSFGKKLSWADFIFVAIVESTNLFLGTEVEKKFPTIYSLVTKVHSLPGVKEYVAKREPYQI